MKTMSVLRWVLAALMLLALTMVLSSPALAEVEPLPLDQLVPGQPAQEDGWTYVPAAEAGEGQMLLKYSSKTREWTVTDTAAPVSAYDWARYEDGSISVEVTFYTARPAYEPVNLPCAVVRIRIADPSQLRTTMSFDSYDKRDYVKAEDMSKHVNAIAAVNGDFFKYHYNVGYVVRQGVFYRDSLNGKRDLLLIDQNGDFHIVYAATSEATADTIAEMEQQGLTVVNSFTLGPVLVENGQARVIKETVVAESGEFQWPYPQQRVAICQIGPLEYAIVEAYGKTDSTAGMNMQEFADFIAFVLPDCQIAYNLDGGGSTNVMVNSTRIHKTPGARKISDIIYFASAYTDGSENGD